MIDHGAVQMAARARALTLVICTTGAVQLSATATGYARSSGSFLTDGFLPGMEIAGVGFTASANNAPKTVTVVSALALSCAGCVTEAAGSRTLTVGLPAIRAWRGVQAVTVVPGRLWIEEDYVPGPTHQDTFGPGGRLTVLPSYILKLYFPANLGIAVPATYLTALLAHFPPTLQLALASGDLLRVRADAGPYADELVPDTPGWMVAGVHVPLRLYSYNSI